MILWNMKPTEVLWKWKVLVKHRQVLPNVSWTENSSRWNIEIMVMEFSQKFKQFRWLQHRCLYRKYLWTFLLVTEDTNPLDVVSIATTVMRMKLWHYEELRCLARDIFLNKICFNTPDWKVSVVGQDVCTALTAQISTGQIRTWQCFILRLNKGKLNILYYEAYPQNVFFSLFFLPNQYSSVMHKFKAALRGFFLLKPFAVEDFPTTIHSLSAFVLQTYSRSLSFLLCSAILPLFQGKISSLLPAVSAAGRVESLFCPPSRHYLLID